MSISSISNITTHQCTTINYRNAIYQGHLIHETFRSGYGIVYIANTHQFIACSNWLNDQINQNCIFFNSDDHYCYGEWLDNKPHGLNLIRVGQISLVGQFIQGKIQKGNKILIHYEKYSVAAVFIVKKEISFIKSRQQNQQNNTSFNNFQEHIIDSQTLELYVKKELLSKQQLKELYIMCGWGAQDYDQFQSLIRFMYSKMNYDYHTNKSKKVKLRLINNIYYRFGYDHGLALVFNDQYKRISVGYHDKSALCSYGALFTQSTLGAETQQGIFNEQQQIFVFPNQSRPQSKIGKIYSTNLLMEINFVNKFYQNPSVFYLNIIQNLLHTNLLKSMVSGYITTRRILQNFESQQTKKQLQPNNIKIKATTPQKKNQKFNAPSFNQNQNTKPVNQIQQQKKRLQAIKKQIYNSIQRRKNQAIKEKSAKMVSQQNSRIINYQQVGAKSKVSFSQPQNSLKTPQKTQKSKSKKKIFKELKNGQWVPSQFSPQEVKSSSLTPFKQKMKHRIFQNKEVENEKLEVPHRSPKTIISNNHPHSSYKVPIPIQQNNNSQQSISKYQSPYEKFNATQNQQTKVKVHYPVTNLNPSKSKLRINQSESPHVNSYLQNSQGQEKQEKEAPKSEYVKIDQRELEQISAKKRSLKDKANQQKYIKVLEDIEQETSSKGQNKPLKNAYEPIFIVNNKNKKQEQFHSNQKRKNQIYLIQPKQQRSKSRNKNDPYSKRYEPLQKSNYENQIQRSSNSYASKHYKKKQIQREISKSPDRYRCYGNNLNNINSSQTKSKQKSSVWQNHPYTTNNYPQVSNRRHNQYKNSQFEYQKMF